LPFSQYVILFCFDKFYLNYALAVEIAEDAARTKSEFLANMSHELRTPLTAVISMAELLDSTNLDVLQRGYVDTVSNSADRLLTQINDVLDFSKIEAKKLDLEIRPFNLRECIENSLDLVALAAAKKNLDLAYHLDETVPLTILGDSTRISQILTNLLSNAVKFTDKKEVYLSVTNTQIVPITSNNERLKTSYHDLQFSVLDTGIGIPPERIPELFNAFVQLDPSTTRKFGGTGLGLAISKKLVNSMGGDIWVESSGVPGEGTVFHFSIRVESIQRYQMAFLRRRQNKLFGLHVLIICDKERSSQVLTKQLSYWGMNIYTFESLAKAQKWFKPDQPIDLVILGSADPQKQYLDIMEKMINPQGGQNLPLILLKATGDSQPVANVLSNFAGFIYTPIKPARLYDLLMTIFDSTLPMDETLKNSIQPGLHVPLNILLAEDDPTNRVAIGYIMKELGYEVDMVSNGLEVIENLEKKPYDLILLDLQMPEMDGLTTTLVIRENEGVQPFIVVLTADISPETRTKLLQSGANLYLTKPIRRKTLQGVLGQVVKHQEKNGDSASGQKDQYPVAFADEVIDETVLAGLIKAFGDQAQTAIAGLLDSFLENVPGLVTDLKIAADHQNWDRLKWLAHTLKGNCDLIGANQIIQNCKTINAAILEGSYDVAADCVDRIALQFEQVRQVLIIKRAQF
jgi:CheY-like chemotaxis protein/HPt (histidine-containing phosphotransfer) domain-containing protein